CFLFFFSSRRRHTRSKRDWSSDVCSSDLLRADRDLFDVLGVTLPAGTLSGSPKPQAMQLINQLEPVKRGIYGGAIGYMGFNGGIEQAIAIRTGIIKDKRLYIQAGAGVVADSVAENEWQETMNKGRALFAAVNMVLRGLTPEQPSTSSEHK